MELCDKCAPQLQPLIDVEVRKAKSDFESKFVADLKSINEIQTKQETLALAKTEADNKAKELQTEIDKLKGEKATLEKEKTLAAAGVKALEEFEKRKAGYPEDKHADVKRILAKIQIGEASTDDMLNLADWKTVENKVKDGELRVAGSSADKTVKTMSNEDIDKMLGLDKWQGYPTKGAK